MNKQEALEMYKSGVWETWTTKEIVDFQLYEKRLCMPWTVFHAALEEELGRGIMTSEFAHPETLRKELESQHHE